MRVFPPFSTPLRICLATETAHESMASFSLPFAAVLSLMRAYIFSKMRGTPTKIVAEPRAGLGQGIQRLGVVDRQPAIEVHVHRLAFKNMRQRKDGKCDIVIAKRIMS